MRASSGSSRSIGLHIEGRSAEDSESGRLSGELGSPIAVVAGVLPIGCLPPPARLAKNIRAIPVDLKNIRAAVRYADAMGPSRVEPSFAKTFATRYGPPYGF